MITAELVVPAIILRSKEQPSSPSSASASAPSSPSSAAASSSAPASPAAVIDEVVPYSGESVDEVFFAWVSYATHIRARRTPTAAAVKKAEMSWEVLLLEDINDSDYD